MVFEFYKIENAPPEKTKEGHLVVINLRVNIFNAVIDSFAPVLTGK